MERIQKSVYDKICFFVALTSSFYTLWTGLFYYDNFAIYFCGVICSLAIIFNYGEYWQVKGFKKKC